MSTLMELAGKLSLDSSGWAAGVQKAVKDTEQLTRATGQITVASEAVAGAASWEQLEQKLLAVTDQAGQAAVGAEQLGEATAAGASEGAAAVEDLAEAEGQAAQAAEATGDATQEGATKGMAAVEGLTGQVEGLQSALQMAMQIGGAAFAFEGVRRAGEKYLAYGEAGAALLNLERGFNTAAEAAGTSGTAMQAAIRAVGRDIVDDDFAMREFILTTRMAGAEIGQQWPELIKVAMASTAQGIGTVEDNLSIIDQYIRTGFGRGLKMQMGLAIPDAVETMEAYAASLGKMPDQLTEAEQAQARFNVIMAAGEAQFGDLDKASSELAGGGITRFRNALEDITEEAQMGAAPAIDAMADSLSNLASAGIPAIAVVSEFYGWQQKIASAPAPEGMPSGEFLGGAQGMLDKLMAAMPVASAFRLLGAGAQEAGEAIGKWLAPAAERAFAGVSKLPAPIEALARALGVATDDATEAESAVENLGYSIASLPTSTDLMIKMHIVPVFTDLTTPAIQGYHGPAAGVIADQQRRAAGTYTQLEYERLVQGQILDLQRDTAWQIAEIVAGSSEPVKRASETAMEYATRLADWQISEAQRAATGSGGAYEDATASLDSYLSAYQSAQQGLLSPTMGADITALEDRLGMHTETWDEKAKRALDVVNRGMESPWAAPMGLESQQEALQYYKDFYAGGLPEEEYGEGMGAAVEQFRSRMEAMIGQQNLQGMFSDALASAGLGPDSALVADALGPQGGPAAEAFATAFAAHDWGLVGTNAGAAIGKTLPGAMTAALKNPTAQITLGVRDLIINVVHQYFGLPINPPMD